MKLFTFRYIHTDQSTGSEVNLSVSYFKKLKPLEIDNLNSQAFFIYSCNVAVTDNFSLILILTLFYL